MIGLLMEDGLFTIVRLGPSTKDPLGRPTRAVLSRTRSAGRLEQTGSVEGEAFVVNRFRAFLPLRTDLREADEIECRGRRYAVEGEPSVEAVPGFPAVSNLTAVLRFVGAIA